MSQSCLALMLHAYDILDWCYWPVVLVIDLTTGKRCLGNCSYTLFLHKNQTFLDESRWFLAQNNWVGIGRTMEIRTIYYDFLQIRTTSLELESWFFLFFEILRVYTHFLIRTIFGKEFGSPLTKNWGVRGCNRFILSWKNRMILLRTMSEYCICQQYVVDR